MYFLALLGDWLQGPYVYKLYAYYGFKASQFYPPFYDHSLVSIIILLKTFCYRSHKLLSSMWPDLPPASSSVPAPGLSPTFLAGGRLTFYSTSFFAYIAYKQVS